MVNGAKIPQKPVVSAANTKGNTKGVFVNLGVLDEARGGGQAGAPRCCGTPEGESGLTYRDVWDPINIPGFPHYAWTDLGGGGRSDGHPALRVLRDVDGWRRRGTFILEKGH
jgi:hypothetical protein